MQNTNYLWKVEHPGGQTVPNIHILLRQVDHLEKLQCSRVHNTCMVKQGYGGGGLKQKGNRENKREGKVRGGGEDEGREGKEGINVYGKG